MGLCFECQVRIDGQPGRRACLTPAAAGMQIETEA
jgi:sarcosine oxidase subunit alpha